MLEDIILDANETDKIKWLYQNQLVKSSKLTKSSIKLELMWDGYKKQKFKETFVETV